LDHDCARPVPRRTTSGRRSVWLTAFIVLWLVTAVAGLWVVWAYDNTPGATAVPVADWPAGSRLERASDRATLVLLAHPRCSCTPASIGELAEVIARVRTPPRTYVVFLKPSTFDDGWERTPLWQSAARIPNVNVVRDDDGLEARQFSGATSGQTYLYDSDGVLQFSGGITSARGHAGDNPGCAALVALLERLEPDQRRTNVFGCPLFASVN
jgi:hypothetical protein